MATIAIMLSGNAVPTAARRLPTAPCCIPNREPKISTAFVNKAAPRKIAISANKNSTMVINANLASPFFLLEQRQLLPTGAEYAPGGTPRSCPQVF
jgi:hypothetical protein